MEPAVLVFAPASAGASVVAADFWGRAAEGFGRALCRIVHDFVFFGGAQWLAIGHPGRGGGEEVADGGDGERGVLFGEVAPTQDALVVGVCRGGRKGRESAAPVGDGIA